MTLLFAAYCSGKPRGRALLGLYRRSRVGLHVTHDREGTGSVLIVLYRSLGLIDGRQVLAL